MQFFLNAYKINKYRCRISSPSIFANIWTRLGPNFTNFLHSFIIFVSLYYTWISVVISFSVVVQSIFNTRFLHIAQRAFLFNIQIIQVQHTDNTYIAKTHDTFKRLQRMKLIVTDTSPKHHFREINMAVNVAITNVFPPGEFRICVDFVRIGGRIWYP